MQTDSGAWGNFYSVAVPGITEYSSNYGATWNAATTKQINTSRILKTGNSNYTKRNNLYDIAGNVWEWTNETYNTSRVPRGSAFNHDAIEVPAAIRSSNPASYFHGIIGFRVALYLK